MDNKKLDLSHNFCGIWDDTTTEVYDILLLRTIGSDKLLPVYDEIWRATDTVIQTLMSMFSSASRSSEHMAKAGLWPELP